MSEETTVLWVSAVITVGIQLSGFVVAYALRTEVFYDILGGINFLAIGIYSAIDGSSWLTNPRKITNTITFIVSRSWLLFFLAWRAHERKGDSRFDNIKNRFFVFLFVWMLQGIWVFSISLPIIFVNGSEIDYDGFSALDIICSIGFIFGVLIEIIADIQKSVWVKAGRQGGFCNVGIWKLSRHPNYFGEILQWWSAFGFAFNSGTGWDDAQWWTSILSPIFTMQILLNSSGTGVVNANGKNLKRYYDKCPEEYAAYRKSTSILIPVPFGLYDYVPMLLKRTIFFDFKCYEYPGEVGGDDVNNIDDDDANATKKHSLI
mmetsp:Transcript_1379/g.1856  ORF Transcript_1379/g.1856 Transcript_1379/m.1856 type:complete len:318 (+) Transcript_1379:133-1086(+)